MSVVKPGTRDLGNSFQQFDDGAATPTRLAGREQSMKPCRFWATLSNAPARPMGWKAVPEWLVCCAAVTPAGFVACA